MSPDFLKACEQLEMLNRLMQYPNGQIRALAQKHLAAAEAAVLAAGSKDV